ncbi:MAG: riboflavin synthase [Chloroflexaceae bacterium]|nr:riboflavin synthase [Chloroflexaceae bacterium]
MFTGIVEEIGYVERLSTDAEQHTTLQIMCKTALEGTRIGDSIAVNGVCLTVTGLEPTSFRVGVAQETLRRTNLSLLRAADPVNLERSLVFNGRMGGHYVQGHIDSTGEIVRVVAEGDSQLVTVRLPRSLMHYVVEKGYLAVDGVSLTVFNLTDDSVTIALIAHTQQAVIMGRQAAGAVVNLEVDIIAKYVERMLQRG